ncbi:MAG: DsrE family protein [Rhizobiales bacterium]|nr:DsrE family protein [Hyphomicrobiales bacterium]
MRRAIVFVLGLLAGLALAFTVPLGRAHDADTLANSAPQKNPLFINMTTGDSWRGWMGLHFAHATLKMGHPVAVFLNLDAVKLAVMSGEQEKKPSMQRVPRDILADFIRDGGVVLMCGPCLAEFGLKLEDLVPGVQMGKPGYTQSFIFAENARTLSW